GEKSRPQELPVSYFLNQKSREEKKPMAKAGRMTKNKYFRFQCLSHRFFLAFSSSRPSKRSINSKMANNFRSSGVSCW
ncbi:13948_t:CDS:1, partial [Racocetra persica]